MIFKLIIYNNDYLYSNNTIKDFKYYFKAIYCLSTHNRALTKASIQGETSSFLSFG